MKTKLRRSPNYGKMFRLADRQADDGERSFNHRDLLKMSAMKLSDPDYWAKLYDNYEPSLKK